MQVEQRVKIWRYFESHFQDIHWQVNVAFNESISSMRRVELSFSLFSRDTYYNFKKVEKKELHERQSVQIDRFFKHFWQSSEISDRATCQRFNEDSWSSFCQSDEWTQKSQLRNSLEIVDETNLYDLKYE
jgi:hypothetical protein